MSTTILWLSLRTSFACGNDHASATTSRSSRWRSVRARARRRRRRHSVPHGRSHRRAQCASPPARDLSALRRARRRPRGGVRARVAARVAMGFLLSIGERDLLLADDSIVAGRRVARIAPASARCFDRAAASSRASDDRPRRPSAPRSIRARDRSLDDPSPSFRPDATLDALLRAANKR